MSSSAEDAKTLGNRAFAKGKYAAAVEAYTEAISLSPRPVYYTNRANAHMKRGAWRAAADDCASALALGSVATRERIKAHYFLGRAHVELGEWQSGIEALATAHALCKEETVPFKDDIRSALLGARKRAWEAAAPAGGRAIKALRRELPSLGQSLGSEEERAAVVETATRAVGWLEETHGLPRQSLPDYLTCQICMDLLLDPVITPCGITYDRACLQRHLEARGSSGGEVDADRQQVREQLLTASFSTAFKTYRGACVPCGAPNAADSPP